MTWTADASKIGARIARYRRLAGLSAQALADQAGAGLTRSVIANIESGRRDDIGVVQLTAIAETVHVPLLALLLDLDDPDSLADVEEGRTALDVLAEQVGWDRMARSRAEQLDWPASAVVHRAFDTLLSYFEGLEQQEDFRGRGDAERLAVARGLAVTVDSLAQQGIRVRRGDLLTAVEELRRAVRASTVEAANGEVEPGGTPA